MVNYPFCPHRGSNQQVTAAGTSATITLDPNDQSVRIVNTGGTNPAHVRIGTGTQVASVADTPVMPGEVIVLRKAVGENNLGYFSASGTTLEIQTGSGGV